MISQMRALCKRNMLPAMVLALTMGLWIAVAIRAAQPAAFPHFTNVAGNSGLVYRTRNGFNGRKYFPQPMCGGVAILDFDGDGKQDIFFTNGAALPENRKVDSSYYHCLLRNKGNGTFEDVTRKAGVEGVTLGYTFGVAAGDFDNDGYPDLFIAAMGRNTLYHNNGDGTFTDVTVHAGLAAKPEALLSVSAAWFDYDNDGLLDLVVSNYTQWTPETDVRCRKDGITDIYCDPRTYRNVSNRLYRNLGGGKFEDVTEQSGFGKASGKGMGIAVADFNGDGFMDVFIANDTERNLLYMNLGNGTFEEAGLLYGAAFNDDGNPVSGMGTDAKDFNNDGRVDVTYNDLKGQVFGLLQNTGPKSFVYSSATHGLDRISRSYSGWSMAFADINNDGWQDIYSANGDVDNIAEDSKQHDSIFENIGGQTFRDVSNKLGPDFLYTGYQRGAAFGDFNNDGALDLVVTSLEEKPRILFNSGVPGNHWLTVDATGVKSNRDAIGARMMVVMASGRKLYNHVTTSQGFMSSADKRVHFGLGAERVIRYLEVHWPSGVVQRIDGPASDQILKLRESR